MFGSLFRLMPASWEWVPVHPQRKRRPFERVKSCAWSASDAPWMRQK